MKMKLTATPILKGHIILFFLLFLSSSSLSQIYVSTIGLDSNPGTFDQPLKTIPAAVTKAQAGDTIFMRAGVYALTTTFSISKDGSAAAKFYLFGYKDERPLLDFSSMPTNSSNRGINLRGDYWHVKGLDIKGAGDNGMNLSGSNDIIEFCSFSENDDTGLQLSGGAANNKIINCDSYFNADPTNENADGFAPKLDVGNNNYFYGCRAWQNLDDGWDGYLRDSDDITTTLENCWSFANGYRKNGNSTAPDGDGNGFKMGGSDDKTRMHNITLKNCISFDNRVKGFDQNSNKGNMTLYNCTGYRNGTNYSITTALNTGKTANIVNGVALGSAGSLSNFVMQKTNSWLSPFVVSNDDFVSIDTAGVRGPRKSDGSLPDINFMHLAAGSDLINAGTDIGFPYGGSAPDLGAFEYDFVVPVELTSFTAFVVKNSIVLHWSTATESNNLGFEIQRASYRAEDVKTGEFYTIGFVRGSGTSSEKKEYRFNDNNISSVAVCYRLKQVDFNGTYSYSNEILVNNNIPAEFSLSQNYPNPFNPSTRLQYAVSSRQFIELKVYDVLGNETATLVNEVKEPGQYEVQFNASGFSSGIYFYELTAGSFKQSKKMLLLK